MLLCQHKPKITLKKAMTVLLYSEKYGKIMLKALNC
jgi:hypothetical protein